MLALAVPLLDTGSSILRRLRSGRPILDADNLRVDGAITIDVAASAWNCPKYITPRYTTAQINADVQPLRDRIADLEAQLNALRTSTN